MAIDGWPPIQQRHDPAAGHHRPVKVRREGEGEADHFSAADDGIDDQEDDLVRQAFGGDENAAVEEGHAVPKEHGRLCIAEDQALYKDCFLRK